MKKPIARGDYVVATGTPNGPVGLVRRVAKDGSWADVWFVSGHDRWSKRMKTKYLVLREFPK